MEAALTWNPEKVEDYYNYVGRDRLEDIWCAGRKFPRKD
jgi:hypothetical protein